MRYFRAEREWLAARGTKGEDAALTRHGNALAGLRHFDERLSYLRELQAEVRRRKAEGTYVKNSGEPPVVKLGRRQRQVTDTKRWKPRTPDGKEPDPMQASPSSRAPSRGREESNETDEEVSDGQEAAGSPVQGGEPAREAMR